MHEANRLLPVVVLISGGGTNLQAIIDAAQQGLPIEIRAVISNRPDAYGLERARRAGIPTEVLIDSYQPELVLLAGFMRILTPEFVHHYAGRMFNIHPSLLPRHQGLDTHQRALEAGDTEHGASIHFVTEELDGGPVILQARVPVKGGDTPDVLAARGGAMNRWLLLAVLLFVSPSWALESFEATYQLLILRSHLPAAARRREEGRCPLQSADR